LKGRGGNVEEELVGVTYRRRKKKEGEENE